MMGLFLSLCTELKSVRGWFAGMCAIRALRHIPACRAAPDHQAGNARRRVAVPCGQLTTSARALGSDSLVLASRQSRAEHNGGAVDDRVVRGVATIAVPILIVAPWLVDVLPVPAPAARAFGSSGYVATVAVALYLASAMMARRQLLGAAVEQRGRSRAARLRGQLSRISETKARDTGASDLLNQAIDELDGRTPLEAWTGALGRDMAVHGLLDEAELALARADTPAEALIRLGTLEPRLDAIATSPSGRRLQRRIRQAREAGTVDNALVREVLWLVLDAEFNAGEAVATQHAKNGWLLAAGSLLVVLVAAIGENPELLLLGALGAFVSRLFALLRSDALSAQFRFTWTANLLGPIYGALVAYGAILAIVALREFQVLGQLFVAVNWGNGTSPVLLGLAFLLGFSERLVERVVDTSQQLLPSTAEPSAQLEKDSKSEDNDKHVIVDLGASEQADTSEDEGGTDSKNSPS